MVYNIKERGCGVGTRRSRWWLKGCVRSRNKRKGWETTPAPSAFGKTLMMVSTHGNMTTEVMGNGKPLAIGVNACIKK
jgi:hypothetical protein